MSDTIYLRLGTSDRITLQDFIDSLSDFRFTLQELDATISENKDGNMIWEVVALQKNSPALVGVAPRLKKNRQDVSTYVESQLIENARRLASRGDRTPQLSDRALDKLQRLSSRTSRIGPMELYLNGDGGTKRALANITTTTYEHVKELTSPIYSEFGSVFGNLDSISVHKGHEFRVWNEENNRAVKCVFEEKELENVKSLLKQKVVVSGIVKSNVKRLPISIVVEDLAIAPELYVPTIDEMIGLVPDITEGLSMHEYMERLSDE